MRGGHYCVAGWCAATNSMVRPLPNGGHWNATLLAAHHVVPGALIRVQPNGPGTGSLPHRREDAPVAINQIQHIGNAAYPWFGPGAPPTAQTLDQAFEGHIQYNGTWQGVRKAPYVADGVDTRSLWAIQALSDNLRFLEEFGKLKATLRDGTATYKMAVTCRSIREVHRQHGLTAVQQLFPTRTNLHIRIGLARSWDDEPDKCYAMINGVYR